MIQLWHLILCGLIIGGPVPIGLYLNSYQYPRQPMPGVTKIVLSTLTIWCIIQVSLGLVLGSLKQFSIGPVLGFELFFVAIGVILFCTRPGIWDELQRQFVGGNRSRLQLGEIWIIAATAFVAFVLLERVATQPLTDWDTLWFHAPIIARWYQTASLSQLDPLGNWIIEHPQAEFYPYNWHILAVFFLLPFHQDFLIALPMLLAWLMLGLAVYLLALSFGAERFYALAGATLALSAPALLNRVTTLHIDLPVATICLVSLYYLIAYQSTRCSLDASLFLATAGLLTSIKTPGVIYAGLLLALAGSLELRRIVSKRKTSPIFKSPLVGLGLIALLFLGGFWYVKVLLGNGHSGNAALQASALLAQPKILIASNQMANLLPQSMGMLPPLEKLWDSITYLQSSTLTAQFNLTNPAHWLTFGSQALMRFQVPLIALALQAMLTPYAWAQCSSPKQRRAIIALSFIFFTTFALYWNTPYSAFSMKPTVGYNMRYGFPAFGMLGVVAAVSASVIQTNKRLVIVAVSASAIFGVVSSTLFDKIRTQSITGNTSVSPTKLVDQLFRDPFMKIQTVLDLITGMGLTDIVLYLAVFAGLAIVLRGGKFCSIPWPKLVQKVPSTLLPRGLVVATFLILAVASTTHLQTVRDTNRREIFQGVYDVIESAVNPGESMAYFRNRQSYPFYGKNLDKSVIHLPPNPEEFTAWAATLQNANITVLAVQSSSLDDATKQALAKLLMPQGSLTPIFGQDLQMGPTLPNLYQVKYPN